MTAPAKGAHTPTPWRLERHGPDSQYHGNIVRVWTEDGNNYVTTITCQLKWHGSEQAEADAAFIVTACNAYATLLAHRERLEAALASCVKQFENMDENMPTDAGCIECTAGTVPNNLNTGLCGYHAARAALEVPK